MEDTFQDTTTSSPLPVDAWNATLGHFNFSAKFKGQWLQSQVAGKLAWQAQTDIMVEENGPDDLLGSGRSPVDACRWLDVRKTGRPNLWDWEIVLVNVSFLFCFVLLHLLWMTPIFLLLFYDNKEIKITNAHCANIICISLAWRKDATREIWINFFFTQILKEMLSYEQPFYQPLTWSWDPSVSSPESSGGEVRHSTHGQIQHWNSTGFPFAGKMYYCLSNCRPQLRGTFSLRQSGNASLNFYTTQLLL